MSLFFMGSRKEREEEEGASQGWGGGVLAANLVTAVLCSHVWGAGHGALLLSLSLSPEFNYFLLNPESLLTHLFCFQSAPLQDAGGTQ